MPQGITFFVSAKNAPNRDTCMFSTVGKRVLRHLMWCDVFENPTVGNLGIQTNGKKKIPA